MIFEDCTVGFLARIQQLLSADIGLGIIDGIHRDEAALTEIPDGVAAFPLAWASILRSC